MYCTLMGDCDVFGHVNDQAKTIYDEKKITSLASVIINMWNLLVLYNDDDGDILGSHNWGKHGQSRDSIFIAFCLINYLEVS